MNSMNNNQVQDLLHYVMPENGSYTITVNQQTNQAYTNLRTTRLNNNNAEKPLVMSLNIPTNQRQQIQSGSNVQNAQGRNQANRTNPKNIQILQNISLRGPNSNTGSPSHGNGGVQRIQQRVIQGTITGTQRGLNMASQYMNTFMSNEQIVIDNTSKNRHQGSNAPIAIPRALPQTVVPQQGNLEINIINDYPEYTFIMHGFSKGHKNIMPEMAPFVRDMYHVLVTPTAYMLMITVEYNTCSCVEVEANIFGGFVCKLIAHILETRYMPFTLEIKCAPKNWSHALKKSIVVGKHNYPTAAKKVAQSLGNREINLPEDQLPEKLDLKFTMRRGSMRIYFHIGSEPAETIFTNICKSVLSLTKTKETPKDIGVQTDFCSVAPARFMELHNMQAQLTTSSTNKQNTRYATIFTHLQTIEEMSQKQKEFNIALGNDLQCFTQLRRSKLLSSSKKTRSKSAQTKFSVSKIKSTSQPWPSFDTYNSVVRKVITYSTKHYKAVQIGIEKLERANKHIKLELEQKRNDEKLSDSQSKSSQKKLKETEPKQRASAPKSQDRLDKNTMAKIHVNMLKYMTEYERILNKFNLPKVELAKSNADSRYDTNSASLMLCGSDFDSLLNMSECELVPLESIENLIEFCDLDETTNSKF